MKITKKYLEKLIEEELRSVINEKINIIAAMETDQLGQNLTALKKTETILQKAIDNSGVGDGITSTEEVRTAHEVVETLIRLIQETIKSRHMGITS